MNSPTYCRITPVLLAIAVLVFVLGICPICLAAPMYVIDLGLLPSDINNSAQVIGSLDVGGFTNHAVLWESGTVIDLGTLSSKDSFGAGINNQRQVVGAYEKYISPSMKPNHAFLWENGMMTDLGTMGYTCSEATGNPSCDL